MRTAGEASARWQRLKDLPSLPALRQAIHDPSNPIANELRSVCWKIFLLFEDIEQSGWLDILADSRSTYDDLRSHYLRAIHNPDEFETGVDPLSETEESPWVALRKDEALRAEIFQDVERCMPENAYFREPSTQTMLVDVLFIYCKLNPDIGYRQGMHEVLAPILWAVERDALDVETFAVKDTTFQHRYKLMPSVLDPKYIEHDTFTLFGLIMQTAKSFYDPGPVEGSNANNVSNDTPMLQRSRKIFDQDLALLDAELHNHLVKLEIVPQIYLMRWVRLLFGREFPFDEVLSIWDLLFAEDPQLELVDHICIAMLLRIRWELLEADTNAAFALLLRYPAPPGPAKTFVEDALELRKQASVATAHEIILKRTNRATSVPDEPATRSRALSRRPQSPSKSPTRFVPQPGSLEAMLQSAAKDVYNRSQKLGLNKAVRDAVGEVRKNMQGLQSSLTSPRLSSDGLSSPGPDRQSTADLLARISALEMRNKHLAQMLQTSVTELWECQAERAEAAKDNEKEKASLEALSGAIAKVQFVQVYLEDNSVPLPIAENETNEVEVHPSSPPPKETSSAGPTAVTETTTQITSPKITVDSPNLTPVVQTTTPIIKKTPAPTSRTRPSISSSSFSWMLSQDPEPSRTFASTASRNSYSERRKKPSLSGKGFLFGEADDDETEVKGKKDKGGKSDLGVDDEESIDLGAYGGSVR